MPFTQLHQAELARQIDQQGAAGRLLGPPFEFHSRRCCRCARVSVRAACGCGLCAWRVCVQCRACTRACVRVVVQLTLSPGDYGLDRAARETERVLSRVIAALHANDVVLEARARPHAAGTHTRARAK
eukprot:6183742-Pleurochrysis_carterae.AAC.1